jgi:hypothetical protein
VSNLRGSVTALAVVALTAAFTVAPRAAHAEVSGDQTVYCVTTDNGEILKRAVGELYKEVDRQVASTYVYAERTTVYVCKPEGFVELYSYCKGTACRYDLGEKPPPLIADAGGGLGSSDVRREFLDPDYGNYGPMVDPIDAF